MVSDMASVKVLQPFRDLLERCDRAVGEEFECTNERAQYIDSKLPGYIEFTVSDDYASLRNAELIELCEERGIEVPRNARKAELIALLRG